MRRWQYKNQKYIAANSKYVWIFIAQMVEPFSTNPEAAGSNPVEVSSGLFAIAEIAMSTATIICSFIISK